MPESLQAIIYFALRAPTLTMCGVTLPLRARSVDTDSHGEGDTQTPIRKSANKSLQGSGTDKVLGRGRSGGVLKQVVRARVLKGTRPAPELSR